MDSLLFISCRLVIVENIVWLPTQWIFSIYNSYGVLEIPEMVCTQRIGRGINRDG